MKEKSRVGHCYLMTLSHQLAELVAVTLVFCFSHQNNRLQMAGIKTAVQTVVTVYEKETSKCQSSSKLYMYTYSIVDSIVKMDARIVYHDLRLVLPYATFRSAEKVTWWANSNLPKARVRSRVAWRLWGLELKRIKQYVSRINKPIYVSIYNVSTILFLIRNDIEYIRILYHTWPKSTQINLVRKQWNWKPNSPSPRLCLPTQKIIAAHPVMALGWWPGDLWEASYVSTIIGLSIVINWKSLNRKKYDVLRSSENGQIMSNQIG